MTPLARYIVLSAAACLGACSSVPHAPPQSAAKDETASAQASRPRPSDTAAPATKSVTPKQAQASTPPPPKASIAPPKAPTAAPKPATPKPRAEEVAAASKPPPAEKPAAQKPAPLDLKKLEERLKDTNAIGVLTKLSLKNQVDDLVGRFRAYHDGQRPPTLAELRPGFELLLMKVLSLLQDKDTALAHDITASRDAIWSVLADKQKFAEFS